MKKDRIGLSSIQEYNQFRTRIFDAIDKWQNYYNCEPAYRLLVDFNSLQVRIGKFLNNDFECYQFDTFCEDGEAAADAVLDFVDTHCFIR